MENTLKTIHKKIVATILLVAVFFFSAPGLQLLPNSKNIFKAKKIEAAGPDYGRESKTAEFLLGLGTENVTRATNVPSYTTATGWSASEPALSSGDLIKLHGKNIKVDQAQLEVVYYTTATSQTRQDITLNVSKSTSEGKMSPLGEYTGNTGTFFVTGGLTGSLMTLHDATSFFNSQTDTDFENGINVVAGVNAVGPSRFLTTVKLTLTYSVDIETTSHNLVKTVKLPLLSAVNRGTRNTICAVNATCAFTFDLTKIPELTSKSQIQSMSVDMYAQQGATSTASSVNLRMTGSGNTSQFTFADTYTDTYTAKFSWNPLSDSQLNVQSVESIDVVNGLTALFALGGEVTITFDYDAASQTQTDTVRYFISQDTVLPRGNLTQLSTTTVNIANSDVSVKTAWYHVDISPTLTTANLTFGHRVKSSVGNVNGADVAYTLNTTSVRSGNTPTLIHVLDESSAAYSSRMDFGGKYQFSAATAASAPASVEAYITFTWSNADPQAPRTKTLIFGASQKGSGRNTANQIKTESTVINLSEYTEKTNESSYILGDYNRYDSGVILGYGTTTIRVGNTSRNLNEGGMTEPYRKRILFDIPSADFFGAPTSSASRFPISISNSYNNTDYTYLANYIVVTYSTSFAVRSSVSKATTLRTVEYVLGGGTDSTGRTSNENVYFGDNQIGASPNMLPIQLLGKNVKVVSAYIDLSFVTATTGAQTVNTLNLTGSIVGFGGSVNDVPLHENSALQFISTPTAVTGYYHGQHDVTPLFGKQLDDGFWNRGDVQVMFGISTNFLGGTRTMTTMKLVLTYETDFDMLWHDEIKTVRIPLQSIDSLGTRIAACTMGSDCNFTYSKSIPDLVDVVSAHFDVRANIDGTLDPPIYLASGGAQSPTYNSGETFNDSTNYRYVWQIPKNNLNATTTNGVSGTLTFRNNSGSALSVYGIGGELVITYKYNTASTKQLETVSFPVGQQTTAAFAKTLVGTSTPYIANAGATARDVWLRYYTAPYASGVITLYGKVGGAAERSLAMSNGIVNRSGGDRYYYLNLTQDAASFVMPSVGVAGSIAFTSGAQYPTGAEAFVNYVWDGSQSGTTTRTVVYPAVQQTNTNIGIASKIMKPASIYMPQNVGKTYRGGYTRTVFHQSSGGTYGGGFALGPGMHFGLNNSTTTVTTVGDALPYNSVLIKSYTQGIMFGPSIRDGDNYVEVLNSSQSGNQIRYSNEIVVSYDENQDIKHPGLSQDSFRIYMNDDSLDTISPWHSDLTNPLGESQSITSVSRPIRKTDVVRLRMGLTVGTTSMDTLSQALQLQYGVKTTSCSAVDVSWNNVTSGADWIGHDNPSIASQATLPSVKLSKSSVVGQYVEGGLTGKNPNFVAIGQMVEYDFALKRNTATPDTDYCFRMVLDNGKTIDSYAYYPEIKTAGYTPETTAWRFYDDELNETPADNPAWLLNQTALSLANKNIIKLRIVLKDVANEAGSNEKYALQYSTDPTFTDNVEFVTPQSTCNVRSTYCYADSPSLGDNDDSVLSVSKLGVLKGRHNESTSTSSFSPAANTSYEMEYSIKPMRQRTGQVYYFRLYDIKREAPINVNSSYVSPSTQAEGATLGITISGVPKDTIVNENKMSTSTSDTDIPFGLLTLDTSNFLSQLLNIKTNAMDGYTVSMYAKSDLISNQGYTIPSIPRANTNPGVWESACGAMWAGCAGYHTTDTSLNPTGITDRFSATNTWSAISTSTPDEIAFSDIPTDIAGDNVNIVYRVEPKMGTPPGQYSTEIVYVVTPVY